MRNDQYLKHALATDRGDYTTVKSRLDLSRMRLLHAQMGLAGEAGELTDAIKKHIFYGKPLDKENVREECGDILWYMALMLNEVGSSFEEVMSMNVSKLKTRYPDGFTEEDAIRRQDKCS